MTKKTIEKYIKVFTWIDDQWAILDAEEYQGCRPHPIHIDELIAMVDNRREFE